MKWSAKTKRRRRSHGGWLLGSVSLCLLFSCGEGWSPPTKNQRQFPQRWMTRQSDNPDATDNDGEDRPGELNLPGRQRHNNRPPETSPPFPATLTESWLEDGGGYRPRSSTTISIAAQKGHDWGVHRQDDFPVPSGETGADHGDTHHVNRESHSRSTLLPTFPQTIPQVAQDAARAVAYTLTQTKTETQLEDPHVLANLWAGDRYWQDRRPVRQPFDQGRLGIEIDGIIAPDTLTRIQEDPRTTLPIQSATATSASTIRSISLVMAGTLSTEESLQSPNATATTTTNGSVNGDHVEDDDEADNQAATASSNSIPVVVYFNTIKQALAASHELSRLKREEQEKNQAHVERKWRRQRRRQQRRHDNDDTRDEMRHQLANLLQSVGHTRYDSVTIRFLGQEDEHSNGKRIIPSVHDHHHHHHHDKNNQKNKNSAPKLSRKEDTQRRRQETRARSARLRKGGVDPSQGIIVVVQPTDFNQEHAPPGPSIGTVERLQKLAVRASLQGIPVVVVSPRFTTFNQGWDQSGYQQSATFGGLEPPRGPTPWILRDFMPPIYSWVGPVVRMSPSAVPREDAVSCTDNDDDDYCFYSNVSMVQSILHRQRAWHIFAHKQCHVLGGENTGASLRKVSLPLSSDYEYLASTKSGAGRPTKDICLWICQEFASFA